MRKLLTLLMAVVILVMCAACGNPSDGKDKNKDKDKENTTENSTAPTQPTAPQPGNTENTLQGTITGSWGYSEGYMFAYLDGSNQKLYCINDKGENAFTLDGHYYNIINFKNGIAALDTLDKGYYLCDTSGKITSAEELGGTSFILDAGDTTAEMFADGYILLKKTTTSYTGAVEELSIIDAEFNTIVPFSADLYQAYQQNFVYNGTNYYGGYLYGPFDTYLNLRTGVVGEGISQMYENLQVAYESDMWRVNSSWDSVIVYDIRYSGEYGDYATVLDLSEYAETIDAGEIRFSQGMSPVVFRVEGDNYSVKNYFTIMKEDGSFCFEPVECNYFDPAVSWIRGSNGKYLVLTRKNGTQPSVYTVESYDTNGKVAEREFKEGLPYLVNCGEEVLTVNFGKSYGFYTYDLKPLF